MTAIHSLPPPHQLQSHTHISIKQEHPRDVLLNSNDNDVMIITTSSSSSSSSLLSSATTTTSAVPSATVTTTPYIPAPPLIHHNEYQYYTGITSSPSESAQSTTTYDTADHMNTSYQYRHTFLKHYRHLPFNMQLHLIQHPPKHITPEQHILMLTTLPLSEQQKMLQHLPLNQQKQMINSLTPVQRKHLFYMIMKQQAEGGKSLRITSSSSSSSISSLKDDTMRQYDNHSSTTSSSTISNTSHKENHELYSEQQQQPSQKRRKVNSPSLPTSTPPTTTTTATSTITSSSPPVHPTSGSTCTNDMQSLKNARTPIMVDIPTPITNVHHSQQQHSTEMEHKSSSSSIRNEDLDDEIFWSYIPQKYLDRSINTEPYVYHIQQIMYAYGDQPQPSNTYTAMCIQDYIHEWLRILVDTHCVNLGNKKRTQTVAMLCALYPLQCKSYYRWRAMKYQASASMNEKPTEDLAPPSAAMDDLSSDIDVKQFQHMDEYDDTDPSLLRSRQYSSVDERNMDDANNFSRNVDDENNDDNETGVDDAINGELGDTVNESYVMEEGNKATAGTRTRKRVNRKSATEPLSAAPLRRSLRQQQQREQALLAAQLPDIDEDDEDEVAHTEDDTATHTATVDNESDGDGTADEADADDDGNGSSHGKNKKTKAITGVASKAEVKRSRSQPNVAVIRLKSIPSEIYIPSLDLRMSHRSRLRYLDSITSTMSAWEYIKYHKARETSMITSINVSKQQRTNGYREKSATKRFAEWSGFKFVKNETLKLLAYLIHDRIGTLIEIARYLRSIGTHCYMNHIPLTVNEVQRAMNIIEEEVSDLSLQTLRSIVTPRADKETLQLIQQEWIRSTQQHESLTDTRPMKPTEATNSMMHEQEKDQMQNSDVAKFSSVNTDSQEAAAASLASLASPLIAAVGALTGDVNALFTKNGEEQCKHSTIVQRGIPEHLLRVSGGQRLSEELLMSSPAEIKAATAAYNKGIKHEPTDVDDKDGDGNRDRERDTDSSSSAAPVTMKTEPQDAASSSSATNARRKYRKKMKREQYEERRESKYQYHHGYSIPYDDDTLSAMSHDDRLRALATPDRSAPGSSNDIRNIMRYYAIQMNWKVRTRHPLVKEFTERTGLTYRKLRSWVQNNKPRHLKRTPQPGRIGSGNARRQNMSAEEDEELQCAVDHRMPQMRTHAQAHARPQQQAEPVVDTDRDTHMIPSLPMASDHVVAIQQLPPPPGFPVPPFNQSNIHPLDTPLELPSLPPPFPLAHQHYGHDTHTALHTQADADDDQDVESEAQHQNMSGDVSDDSDVIEVDSGSEDISYSESDYSSSSDGDDANDTDGRQSAVGSINSSS